MSSYDAPTSNIGTVLERWTRPLDLGSRHFLIPDERVTAWIVEEGGLDLFAAVLQNGRPHGRWLPLQRLEPGAILLTRRTPESAHQIVGRPVLGARISIMERHDFEPIMGDISPVHDPSGRFADMTPIEFAATSAVVARGIDQALVAVGRALRSSLPPRSFVALDAAEPTSVPANRSARSIGGVQWVQVLHGSVNLGEHLASRSFERGRTVCLTELDWLVAESDSVLLPRPTITLLRDRSLWDEIDSMIGRLGHELDRLVERSRYDEERSALAVRAVASEAEHRLTDQLIPAMLHTDLETDRFDPGHDDVSAARRVAAHLGVQLPDHEASDPLASPTEQVTRFVRSARVRTRTIVLEGEWWKRDLGPMVASLRGDVGAVALIPTRSGYDCYFPFDDRGHPVDRDLSMRLGVRAQVLFRPLPDDVGSFPRLVRWSLAGAKSDVTQFFLGAIFTALIGLSVPILTGKILGSWVALGQRTLVIQGAMFIIASAFAVGALTYLQNIAVLRLQGRIDLGAQAAVWDRLLALPVSFFSKYSAADLGTMALGISAIREAMTNVATLMLVALITLVLNTALVFVYSWVFGLLLLAFTAVWTALFLALWRRTIRTQREAYEVERKLSSRVFQLLNGITVLRVASAEDRAYARWFEDFVRLRALAVKVRRSQALMSILNGSVISLLSILIFWLVSGPMRSSLDIAAFLSVYTALNVALSAVLQITGSAMAVIEVMPTFEEMRPITSHPPEARSERVDPVDLGGHIELRNVSFRYQESGPLVLNDVSFTVQPGEFVAIVGATGSGKSTIVRTLLGFEHPETGSVLYDGRDLELLDVSDVRRQCGVVLQGGALLPGDILTNITGGLGHSVEEAWTAARLAGIAEDIEALPMGMYTYIAEGASTFSGGQGQRLMIARALVSSPRILFFDEATSALDNETQRIVTESTHRLNASRVVVAHRLSTIQLADRIIVLDAGRIVQSGSYEALLADADGHFARLVGRQRLTSPQLDGAGPEVVAVAYSPADLTARSAVTQQRHPGT